MQPPVNSQLARPEINPSGETPPPNPPGNMELSSDSQLITASSEIIAIFIWVFLSLIWVGIAYRSLRSDAYADFLEVPIQATSLMGGAELIGPGDWLSIARYGKGGTPTAEEWRMVGRVSAVSGNDTEKKVIVLGVPTHQAPTLQAALAVKDGPLLIHGPGKEQTPTPTATFTATPTPGPSPTNTPSPTGTPARSGQVGLEIPAEHIASGANIDRQSILSLIIVPKVVSDSEDSVSSTPLFTGCAAFAFFLDDDRLQTDKAADAKTVVVWLAASRLPEAAAALTHAESVYLVPDASCELRQTPAAMPLFTSTPTSTPTPVQSPTPPEG